MNYTHGPWFIEDNSGGHSFQKDWRTITNRKRGQGAVVGVGSYDRTDKWSGETETISGVCIKEDDARLIVAAPEMYEALKRIAHYSSWAQNSTDAIVIMDIARKTLEKIEVNNG